jgi:hypothetical protein
MIYVTARLHTGELIGTMEIQREEHLRPDDRLGEYTYRFKYGGPRCKGDVVGSGAVHDRRRDVWDLIRAVLQHDPYPRRAREESSVQPPSDG